MPEVDMREKAKAMAGDDDDDSFRVQNLLRLMTLEGNSHGHEFGMGSGHEVRDSADLALCTPVEPLAEAAVGYAVRGDGVHHLIPGKDQQGKTTRQT